MSSIFSINQDNFIYAVRQALNARSHANGFDSHLRYPPFLDNSWEKPKNPNLKSLNQTLKKILTHHFKVIPHYKRQENVNLENISWFAHSTACLYADILHLLKETFNWDLLNKSDDTIEFWDSLSKNLQSVFKQYSVLLNNYIEWTQNFNSSTENAKVDWNVRPPCGLLYKTAFKELFEERKNKFKKTHDSFHKPRHEEKNRPSNREFNSKFTKSESRHKQEKLHDKAHLKAALEECKNAIKTMEKNNKIPEIPLSAQNSFIRREQHTLITEAGFFTDSRGEGNHRHVCILRNKKEP